MLFNNILLIIILSFLIFKTRFTINNWLLEESIKEKMLEDQKKELILMKINHLKLQKQKLIEIKKQHEKELINLDKQISDIKNWQMERSIRQKKKLDYIKEIKEFLNTYDQ